MQSTNDITEILYKVRSALQKQGSQGIRGIGRTFRLMKSFDGFTRLDKDEFLIGLKERGVNLKKQETDLLFTQLDQNRDGTIDFNEFLIMIRGQPNERRQQIIAAAFQKFDPYGFGYITPDDFQGIYNVKDHPKVKRGELTQEQVFQSFLLNFADSRCDGKISWQEFYEYYSTVSADIDNDDQFETIMRNSWKL